MFDSANPKSGSPAEPVEYYPVGRFVLPVPKVLKYSGASFNIDAIEIDEHDWTEPDHGRQWQTAWQPLRDEKKEDYLWRVENDEPIYSGFYEEDLSGLFSAPAMLVCYGSGNGGGMHYLDSYIQKPELLLQLREDRFIKGKNCVGVSVQATQLPLYRAYKYGKLNPSPHSFFTEKGRLENFTSKNERMHVGFSLPLNDDQKIVLSFNTYTPTSPGLNSLNSMSKLHGLAARWKVDIDTLRSRRRDFAGREGGEHVMIMTTKDGDDAVKSELYAIWQIQGELGNPQKPYIEIELRASIYNENGDKNIWKKHPEYREQALLLWQAITGNLMTAEEYYGGNAHEELLCATCF